MKECTTQCMATKLLVIGIILILVRLYTNWDIWLVIGAILAIKGILLFFMPMCPCAKSKKK